MTPGVFTWLWLLGGLALLGSELVAPSLVAMFFGTAAVLVAGMRAVGLVESHGFSVALWLALSAAQLWALRGVVQRWFRPEKSRDSDSDNLRAYGAIVEVITAVHETERSGRIRFDGTTWPALSTRGTLAAGTRARLIHRDNLAWVVEPVDALPAEVTTPERSTVRST